jgi:predicted metal-dependent HD superfamily phosphohydrolase
MIMTPDFAAARNYAVDRLARQLAPFLTYHNLWHTRDEVAPRAIWLAKSLGVTGVDMQLVELGAVYHDIGFTVTTDEHECAGAQIAGSVLQRFGLSLAQIAAVQSMIMATKLPQSPHNLLEQIVADADLDSLGREDFASRSRALRKELTARGMPSTDAEWYERQLAFLESHDFFTSAARSLRGEGERRNTDLTRGLLAEARNGGSVPVP